jgi:hypothetical protein
VLFRSLADVTGLINGRKYSVVVVAFNVLGHSIITAPQTVSPPSNFVFINRDSISAFTRSTNVKISFNCKADRSVYYVDFNDSVPVAKKLKKPAGNGGNSDSPLISPDGKWVTYFMYAGFNDIVAFVQRLDPTADAVQIGGDYATDPHWWTDPSTHDVYIIYSNLFLQDSLPLLAGKATFKQKVDLSGSIPVLVGAPAVIADKPMNGGLTKDGRFLCTGYSQAAFYDIAAQKVIGVNPGMQICNSSISPDTSADSSVRMMFLCFAGKQNMINDSAGVVNEHAVIYVVDKADSVQWFIGKPANYGEWQDPEWSNNPNFAAALLGKAGEAKYDGVIIRRSDKQILKVMTADSYDKMDNTSTPYVWIGL